MTPHLARDAVDRHIPPHFAPLRHEAALLTTELVTNAVIHGQSVVDLDLYVDDDGLYLSVADFGPGVPTIRAPDPSGGGYGLRIVDNLATRWGHEMLDPQGKRVWFELRV
jgi:anti-sigma regulatory factor (Ser/Thr protein kinase)